MKTIAILGASRQRQKYGNKALRAYRKAGWKVLPVNLSGEAVEGIDAYRSLAEISEPLDRISIYLPPPVTLELLDEIVAAGAGEVWLNPGSADREVVVAAREKGIPAVEGCSIVDIGLSPAQFP